MAGETTISKLALRRKRSTIRPGVPSEPFAGGAAVVEIPDAGIDDVADPVALAQRAELPPGGEVRDQAVLQPDAARHARDVTERQRLFVNGLVIDHRAGTAAGVHAAARRRVAKLIDFFR